MTENFPGLLILMVCNNFRNLKAKRNCFLPQLNLLLDVIGNSTTKLNSNHNQIQLRNKMANMDNVPVYLCTGTFMTCWYVYSFNTTPVGYGKCKMLNNVSYLYHNVII